MRGGNPFDRRFPDLVAKFQKCHLNGQSCHTRGINNVNFFHNWTNQERDIGGAKNALLQVEHNFLPTITYISAHLHEFSAFGPFTPSKWCRLLTRPPLMGGVTLPRTVHRKLRCGAVRRTWSHKTGGGKCAGTSPLQNPNMKDWWVWEREWKYYTVYT